MYMYVCMCTYIYIHRYVCNKGDFMGRKMISMACFVAINIFLLQNKYTHTHTHTNNNIKKEPLKKHKYTHSVTHTRTRC